ncbi:hypothetical protein E1B28_010972 [Marasmius oreades]|uniref:SAP domain-containing protein n=1 Tax=Marasmius oreades TaxID=181124 RepID=A0A9P7RTR9_9AGAR|nr:uncharacterized protein E1B28_010972 [Marasmius oreades]KAG7089273.1 hypothetical protein E1B28_010972 [Marasmius oreades]
MSIIQERSKTSCSRLVVDHSDLQLFVLNTHALHNHLTISKLLLPSLTSVLSRPPLPSEEQITLCTKAAKYIWDQYAIKCGTIDSSFVPLESEPLPFEGSDGIRAGQSRGQGWGQGQGRGWGSGSHGGGQVQLHDSGAIQTDIQWDIANLNMLKHNCLQELCKIFALNWSGNKALLIARLSGIPHTAVMEKAGAHSIETEEGSVSMEYPTDTNVAMTTLAREGMDLTESTHSVQDFQ